MAHSFLLGRSYRNTHVILFFWFCLILWCPHSFLWYRPYRITRVILLFWFCLIAFRTRSQSYRNTHSWASFLQDSAVIQSHLDLWFHSRPRSWTIITISTCNLYIGPLQLEHCPLDCSTNTAMLLKSPVCNMIASNTSASAILESPESGRFVFLGDK